MNIQWCSSNSHVYMFTVWIKSRFKSHMQTTCVCLQTVLRTATLFLAYSNGLHVFIGQMWVLFLTPDYFTRHFRGCTSWKPALSFINCSLYFLSVNQPELEMRLRLKPVKDAAAFPAFIQRLWQLCLDIHDHLLSISSSLFLSTLLLILRMRWWSHPRKTGFSPGLGENGDMFHWPAHSQPRRVGLKRDEAAGMKHGTTRSH